MWFLQFLAQALQKIIRIIPAQFLLKRGDGGIIIDEQELYTSDLRKIFQVLDGKGVTEAGMMSTSGQYPGGGGSFQIGLWQPECSRHREFWQRLIGGNTFNGIDDHAIVITHIHHGCSNGRTCPGIEHKTYRISLATDGERMNL